MFGFLNTFPFRILVGFIFLVGLVSYGVFSWRGADPDILLEENQSSAGQAAALPLYDTAELWKSVEEEATTTDDAVALAAAAAPVAPEPEKETKPAPKPPSPPPPASNPASLCSSVSSNPVCGANGMTYKNDCLAKTSGTTVASLGACGATTGDAPPPAPAKKPKPAEEEPETQLSGNYPDFITRAVSHFGAVLFEGNSLSFSAIIKNQGTERAFERSYVGLYLDIGNNESFDLSFTPQEVHALEKNEEVQLIWKNAWTQTPGTHTIAACADSTKIIQESLEKNNCETLEFTVLGKKDNADLAVTSISVSPGAPAVGSRPVFSANVFNGGVRAAQAPWFRLWIDGSTKSNSQLTPSEENGYDRNLAPNEDDSISWSGVWIPTAGEHTYKICVDSKEEIPEVNEDNNCKEGAFTVPMN